MKTFLKQNWFKLFIVLAVFVATGISIQWGFYALNREMSATIGEQAAVNGQNEVKVPGFSDFLINEEFSGVPAEVDLASNPDAARYRTIIKDGIAEGPNFGGHYTIISPGCGTECQQIIIVDQATGKVYSAPFVAAEGVKFVKNSSLLVVNPPEIIKEVYEDKVPGWLSTGYYNWEDNKLIKLIEIDYWWKQ